MSPSVPAPPIPMHNPTGHAQEPTMNSLTETVGQNNEDLEYVRLDESQSTFNTSSTGLKGNDAREKIPNGSRTRRPLVVLFDGTDDQFDDSNSNVVKFLSLLKKDNKSQQLVYYQSGIGTYTSPDIVNPLRASFRKLLDSAFAGNLHSHIMSGYEFLMQSYKTGDKICILGFSRGAYTARCLAGMLHKVGLLPTGNFQQVPFAYQMYTQADKVGWERSNNFKRSYSIDVQIEFLGVWDTVSSVGCMDKQLPFTTSNTIVKTFRHAVSLDEHRAKFKANLWNEPTAKDIEKTYGLSKALYTPPGKEHQILNGGEDPTHKLEVWFAGCHADVGGGSVSNKTRFSLSRIPLRWMVRECVRTKTGIIFDPLALNDIGLDPNTVGHERTGDEWKSAVRPEHRLWPMPPNPSPGLLPIRLHANLVKFDKLRRKFYEKLGRKDHKMEQPLPERIPFLGEDEEDLCDMLQPIYDPLVVGSIASSKTFWKFLERIHLHVTYQRRADKWVTKRKRNKGQCRLVLEDAKEFKIHRTVKMRQLASKLDAKPYSPGLNYPRDEHNVTYVG